MTFCDIDSLLGTKRGLCTPFGNGAFQLQVLDATISGATVSILYDFANLINNSNSALSIAIKKLQKALLLGWQTAFCADVCYSPTDDSISVTLTAHDTL